MCWNAASLPRRFELSGEQDAIHQVVGAYYEAFARDPAAAAAFYGEPALIVLPNEILTLATRGDVEAFLAKLLGSLKPLGYSSTSPTRQDAKFDNRTVLHGRNSNENRWDRIAKGRVHLPASQRRCWVENQRSDRN
jgi:hypothetical protein